MSKQSEILSNSTRGASLLVLGQLVTKLFTFLLNQLLIRYISPRVFGVSSYLEVILSTALFFSREGVRLSSQRTERPEKDDKDGEEEPKSANLPSSSSASQIKYFNHTNAGTHQSVVNFGYVALIVGVPISCIITYWQSGSQIINEQIQLLAYYKISITLVWLLLVLELLVEPLYVLNQFQLNFGKRTKIESAATFARCVSTFAVVLGSSSVQTDDALTKDGKAVLAFSIGQFCYSSIIFILYQLDFQKLINNGESLSLKIQKIHNTDSPNDYYYFNPKVVLIWKNIFIQMIFKQFLTEGDRLLINYVCTVEEQGVYSVVTNYGSLVARLLFQPIEESLRLYLTRLLSNRDSSSIAVSKQIMLYLSKFYLYLSILIAMGGFTNGSFLLKTILGKRASSTWLHTDLFSVFPQYTLYIPFLAFNGILESFFNSIATKENIANHSIFMSFLTVIFLSVLYVFIQSWSLGLSGLILANVVNMSVRIIYCLYFIQQFYKKLNQEINMRLVSRQVLLPVGVGLTIEGLQYHLLNQKWMTVSLSDFLKSIAVCFVTLLIALFIERELVFSAISALMKRKVE